VHPADWQSHKKYCKRWLYSRFNKLSNFVESRYHADAEHSEVFQAALEAAKAQVGIGQDTWAGRGRMWNYAMHTSLGLDPHLSK